MKHFLVAMSAVVAVAVFTTASNAQLPGQFQGQVPPQFQGFQGGLPAGALGGNGNRGQFAGNNMGGNGFGAGGFLNRFQFRQGSPVPNTPTAAVNTNLNGRNTTIYSTVNPSAYLGGLGNGQGGQLGQLGQYGQSGQFGSGQYGGFPQTGITYGQPVGSTGQFGQFGQYGQTGLGQFGQVGGVGGKPGMSGFNQIGGGGQFGSRYGL